MIITEDQWRLAFDMRSALGKLSGERFTHQAVERLARGIALHAWVDRQLNEMQRTETGTHYKT